MSEPPHPARAELCTVERIGNTLRLNGEIDQTNGVAVRIRLAAEVRLGVPHIDLSGVAYCGAAGLQALLAAHAARPADTAGLVLTCSPTVFRVLQITGVATRDGLLVRPATSGAGRPTDKR